jgi:hypothetical protein
MNPTATAPMGILVLAVSIHRTIHAARRTPDGWRDQFGNVMSPPVGWVAMPPEATATPDRKEQSQ